ncbi:MAG TPA: immunoglobulin domain-containing protein [Verrucomicrobiales bacterium]|nr:immunoglobulin domain-containing protein [Verrucomicrobiales bacterium]
MTTRLTIPPAILVCSSWILAPALLAGQFKRILVDGSFDDWLGVPVAAVDDADAAGAFDFRDVAIANDDDYLYIRVRLHGAGDYAGFHHQVLVDTDADSLTGYSWGGLGAELFVEDGVSYQQKNGQFNEGQGSNLAWQVSSGGTSNQFEMRLSRATLDAEGLPFFDGDEVTVAVLAQSLAWQLTDSIEGVPYTFANQPEIFHGARTLVDLENTFWFYQEVGDPEPDWLLPDYFGDDTWKGGNGFFSFGFAGGAYPVAVQVPLTPGRTTYYFRTPFLWEHAAEGVALLVDAHFSDGAVIYLNGDQVRRIRMPDGPIDGATQALASAPAPGEAEMFSLPAAALITGENLLMVEIHQAADSRDSLAFGLTLTANDSVPPSLEEPAKPVDREVVEGESTVFILGTIAGTEPYEFQWFKNGEAIPGAIGARLEIPVVLQEDAGSYSVTVSNASGSVQSREAILTTTALPVSFANEAWPADQTLTEGETVTLLIDALGSPPMSYQWYRDDVAIEAATAASLTIDPARLEDAGQYHVTVSNRLNSLTSRRATITVNPDRITPQVQRITAASGTVLIAFTEPMNEASATDPAHYAIPGLAVSGATLGDDGRTVTLATDSLTFGQVHALAIDGVEDLFGNRLSVTRLFRATILIDGDFSDWTGIEPSATDPLEGLGTAFNRFWVVNDEDYLYLRFSFHENIGRLPVDYYYQIFIDGDNDPGTGLTVSTIGSSLMIENGSGWLQTGGGFNEGSISNVDFQLAPETASAEFECRIALSSGSDGVPLFTAETLGITLNLVSTSWVVVDSGPAEAISYPLADLPPLVDPEPPTSAPLTIRAAGNQLEVLWEQRTLETSDTLLPDSWVPVPDATSPYLIRPEGGSRFYRGRD